jgi:hypothetical protein
MDLLRNEYVCLEICMCEWGGGDGWVCVSLCVCVSMYVTLCVCVGVCVCVRSNDLIRIVQVGRHTVYP